MGSKDTLEGSLDAPENTFVLFAQHHAPDLAIEGDSQFQSAGPGGKACVIRAIEKSDLLDCSLSTKVNHPPGRILQCRMESISTGRMPSHRSARIFLPGSRRSTKLITNSALPTDRAQDYGSLSYIMPGIPGTCKPDRRPSAEAATPGVRRGCSVQRRLCRRFRR